MLYFISGNPKKIKYAKNYFDKYEIAFKTKKLKLLEPQLDSVEKISLFKANQAYKKLKAPVLLTDVGWSIPALKGFPGPYMHYIIDKFEANDFLNIMKNKKDRTIKYEVYMVFKGKLSEKIFSSVGIGKFLNEVADFDTYFPLDQVITFRKDEMSAAECDKKGLKMNNQLNENHWDNFCKWYKRNRP